MKIEGWFEIWDGDVLELVAKNDIVSKGARWILSAIANDLAGFGYPVNADKHIHYGNSNSPVNSNQWHLESYTGDLGVVTTVTEISDNIFEFSLDYTTGANAVYISELAIALSASDPSSPTDYSNTVLDRAVVDPTYIIPPTTTKTVKYKMKIQVE